MSDTVPPHPVLLQPWISAVKELGMPVLLTGFICYLLAYQMPEMRSDFRTQTDKLSEAVGNNSRVMGELIQEVRALRRERGSP